MNFKYLRYLALISALLFVSACKQEWSGFLYPNKNELTVDESIGVFKTLEECRDAALMNAQIKKYQNFDYECGLNCKGTSKPYVCEKTER